MVEHNTDTVWEAIKTSLYRQDILTTLYTYLMFYSQTIRPLTFISVHDFSQMTLSECLDNQSMHKHTRTHTHEHWRTHAHTRTRTHAHRGTHTHAHTRGLRSPHHIFVSCVWPLSFRLPGRRAVTITSL